MSKKHLIGPFKQLVTMDKLPAKGAISDNDLEILSNKWILCSDDTIEEINSYQSVIENPAYKDVKITKLDDEYVCLPGYIDPHTHICYAGNRANDYALRLDGKTYIEIAKLGGGIWDTVTKTRQADEETLVQHVINRANELLHQGITTIEVKSGYGLTVDEELKMLRAIKKANSKVKADLVATCLAAHICPKDFWGNAADYLKMITENLLPILKKEKLTNRVDVFIEDSAFTPEEALDYLLDAKNMGFHLKVHADQFTTGGSRIATQLGALSADHLEASGSEEIELLANSETVAVALPGASLGLADPFTPARKLLDAGACLAIGSDWNPGSAPMGDLLTQAAILSMQEKLNTAETLAAVTCRSAAAVGLNDRGVLKKGNKADFIAYRLNDYREILYNQGRVKPEQIFKNGKKVK